MVRLVSTGLRLALIIMHSMSFMISKKNKNRKIFGQIAVYDKLSIKFQFFTSWIYMRFFTISSQ